MDEQAACSVLWWLFASRLLGKYATLLGQVWSTLCDIVRLIQRFRAGAITPLAARDFECALAALLQQLGRHIVDWVYHSLEASAELQAPFVRYDGVRYRRRQRCPGMVATLFGPIRLWAWVYEPPGRGERCIRPLELCLGVQAGMASAALAEQIGQWVAGHTQRQVLALLKARDVHWGVGTLRKLVEQFSEGLAGYRQEAQVAQVLQWLRQAQQSRGRHRPTLQVGRDGVQVPLRGVKYREASTATVSVLDRRGRRLGTVYLAQMPDRLQTLLSEQLTGLLREVLSRWDGPWPRLHYTTDGGYHARQYFEQVLCRWEDPRAPGRYLNWTWILDYYHASERITQLGEALFGATSHGRAWARRMRDWLQQPGGVGRVLRSAGAHYGRRHLSVRARAQYWKAYGYLSAHARWMDYASYRRVRLPIGSGVTEAACKTVFTQRLKQSGMSWNIDGGQWVLDLRVLVLSRVYRVAFEAYLAHLPNVEFVSQSATPYSTARSKRRVAA